MKFRRRASTDSDVPTRSRVWAPILRIFCSAPIEPAPCSSSEPAPFLKYNTEKLSKHLIVDDSSTNRMVLRRYLNSINVSVDEASGGEEAIEMIVENGEYAIVWMDIRMGAAMSGVTCTEILRRDYGYTGAILGLTGYVDESTYKQCMSCKMTQFVSKPFHRGTVKLYSEQYAYPPRKTRASISVMQSCSTISNSSNPSPRRHSFLK